jgi:hypothetical protein
MGNGNIELPFRSLVFVLKGNQNAFHPAQGCQAKHERQRNPQDEMDP